jgi:hypothetical protein
MPPLSADMLWWLALPILLFAPFPVFIRLRHEVDELKLQNKEQSRFNRLAALKAELDLKFGQASNLTIDGKFRRATSYFEGLEREVLAGDFTRAVEVLAIKDIILPTLAPWFGTSTPGYADWHDRIVKVVEIVTSHEEDNK